MIETNEKSSKISNFDKIYKRMLEIFPRVILFKDLFKDVTGNFYEKGTICDKKGANLRKKTYLKSAAMLFTK